jgi:hypothetical protein
MRTSNGTVLSLVWPVVARAERALLIAKDGSPLRQVGDGAELHASRPDPCLPMDNPMFSAARIAALPS